MSNTTAIWDVLSRTDPKHTKGFQRAGGFSGTAIKPIWIVKRLTEQFGPVGMGWGIGEPQFHIVPCGNETLVYCHVACWHTSPAHTFYGVGGDKIVTARKSGQFNDDEAFKKAFTDAVGNAFKFLGVGADVHMGQFEDSKYLREVAAEFAQPANDAPAKKQPQHSALKAAVRQFVHELNGCGDSDELNAFLATPDALKVVNEVKEKLPHWWTGWDEQPDGFTPLGDLITRRQHECAERTASYLTA